MSSPNSFRICARTVAAALAAGAVAWLGGCSSGISYTAPKGATPEQRRASFPINHEEYARIGYRVSWIGYPPVSSVRYLETYPDIVVAMDGSGTVTVMEQGTGQNRCSDQLGAPQTRFVGLARDNSRIVCASDGEAFLVDPQTCTLTTRQKFEKLVATEPVRYGDLIILGTPSGELMAHMTRIASGVKAWGFRLGGAIEHKPVLIGEAVGAVSQQGEVLFLDALSGSLMGRSFVYSGLAVDPVADDHLMYVAGLDQSIYAFAPQGATLIWRVRTAYPLRTQPTVHAGRLYCAIPNQGLTAFDASSGQVVWKCKDFKGTVVGTSHKNLVGFDREAHEAVTIDAERGDVVERAKAPGAVMMKTDRFDDGNLFVVSSSGLVAKFQPK